MARCAYCAMPLQPNDTECPECRRPVPPAMLTALPDRSVPATAVARPSGIARFFWFVSLLMAAFGGYVGIMGVITASGAPQEAAAAAIGCLIAIPPYVGARAVDALTR